MKLGSCWLERLGGCSASAVTASYCLRRVRHVGRKYVAVPSMRRPLWHMRNLLRAIGGEQVEEIVILTVPLRNTVTLVSAYHKNWLWYVCQVIIHSQHCSYSQKATVVVDAEKDHLLFCQEHSIFLYVS